MRYLLFLFFPISLFAQNPVGEDLYGIYYTGKERFLQHRLSPLKTTDTLNYDDQVFIESKPGVPYVVTVTYLDSGATVPTDTIPPCACTNGKDGLPGAAGPQGEKGETGAQGPPGPSGGGTEGPYKFSWQRYGAIPNDGKDDAAAIQACHDAAGNNKVFAEGGSYNVSKTIVVKGSGQLWQSFEGLGGTTTMVIYTGPSNSAVFQILGLKSSKWQNLNISLQGQTGVACIDLTTKAGHQSISDNAFETMRFQLGTGEYCVGIRTGWEEDGPSNNGADISDLVFRNIRVTGSKATGQVGWLNVGRNTLNNIWEAGFWNALDYGYSNIYERSGVKIRGNAGVTFLAPGTSANNCVFYFGFEGGYTIEGGRYELDLLAMKTEAGNHSPIITFTGVDMSNLQGPSLFEVNAAASLNITNCRMSRRGGAFDDLVKVTHPNASVIITGGATLANNIITGTTGYKSVRGLGKWSGTPGVSIGNVRYPDL